MLKYVSALSIVQEFPAFNVPLGDEALNSEKYFLGLGLVCIFNEFWSWLIHIHKCIYNTWKPLLSQDLNIYPLAKVFLVFFFDNFEDKKIIYDLAPSF